jgi:hypothetical protein
MLLSALEVPVDRTVLICCTVMAAAILPQETIVAWPAVRGKRHGVSNAVGNRAHGDRSKTVLATISPIISIRKSRSFSALRFSAEIGGFNECRNEGLWVVCRVEKVRTFFSQAVVFAKWQIPGSGGEKGGRIAWFFAAARGLFGGVSSWRGEFPLRGVNRKGTHYRRLMRGV